MSKIEFLPSVKAEAVRTMRGQIIERKALADMTDLELDGILRSPGRVSQDLVNSVWEEIHRRKTNATIAQARADQELLDERREALVQEGKAENVAINLTNTTEKMLAQGKRLGII